MPSVKACLWNIQNFGQDSGKYNGAGGNNNALRNRFIARFVHRKQIDVLMIMEVQPSSNAALADLLARLNALYPAGNRDWAYSWCGCAVKDNSVAAVATAADLNDRTGARSEGYAVFWRQQQAARYTMIEAVHDIAHGTGPAAAVSPINISQTGRPFGNYVHPSGEETSGALGGFLLTNPYPYRIDAGTGNYDLLDHWPRLNYPPTGNQESLAPRWWGSRRPAYVTIRLAAAPQYLCPIAAYHAPSNAQRAATGAYVSGLARELYAVDGWNGAGPPDPANPVAVRRMVFGGDFNLSVAGADWPGAYTYFMGQRRRAMDGTAAATVIPLNTAGDPARRTTVQIVTGDNHDQPITGAANTAYLSYKIDLAFYPAAAGMTAERVDLLAEVRTNPGNAYTVPLQQAAAYMNAVAAMVALPANAQTHRMSPTGPEERVAKRDRGGGMVYSWRPLISGSWGGTFINWAATLGNFNAGNVTNARRAAEFIHIFVSDHLPLIVTIPV